MERLTLREWQQLPNQDEMYNRLAELEDKIESGLLVGLPCKVGTIVYQIRKYCESTGKITDCKVGYRPLTEILTDCPHYESAYYESPEECKFDKENRDWAERDYCSINLNICCDECKKRLVVEETIFKLEDFDKVYGTPQFNKSTPLYHTLFLTAQQAEVRLKELQERL